MRFVFYKKKILQFNYKFLNREFKKHWKPCQQIKINRTNNENF